MLIKKKYYLGYLSSNQLVAYLVFSLIISSTLANVTIKNLTVGLSQSYNVSFKNEFIINVINVTNDVEQAPPRVYVSCDSCTRICPLLVVVRQKHGVLSWELPLDANNLEPYDNETLTNTARTMCPYDIANATTKGAPSISVSLSTFNDNIREVTLYVDIQKDFIISINEPKNVTLSTGSPVFYAYYWPEDETSVLLHVESQQESCMALSIQHIRCPVFDLDETVTFDGFWQSVTKQSGITISKKLFPNGFYAVFVLRHSDKECSRRIFDENMSLLSWQNQTRTKFITMTLKKTLTEHDYLIYTLSAVSILLMLMLLIAILTIWYIRRIGVQYELLNIEINKRKTDESNNQPGPSAINTIMAASRGSSVLPSPTNDQLDTLSFRTDSSLDEVDIDTLNDLETDKELVRSKVLLTVHDLARKMPSILEKKSRLYLWYLLTVAVFYFLPVVQLVITYQRVIQTTGNQNLCYYNFLCAHPVGLLPDFNHVFSNVGYILLGILFNIITAYRQREHIRAVQINKAVEKKYGIPQHYGLLYAMGASLIIEGIFSACYHVCPNAYNFQFDTSFMYVISAICMMKIYHSRHADVSASAYATFGVMAFVILLGMCGVINGTQPFWGVFTFIHLTTVIWLSIQIYFIRFRIKSWNVIGNSKRCALECYVHLRVKNFRYMLPKYPTRFLMILLANVANWALAILGPRYKIGDFAGYLLMIFMVNLLLYLLFYITMKLINRERINLIACIFIATSFCFWSSSLYFFIHKLVSWQLTPAASKELNQPCIVVFFDNHDLWHFLSAASMFTSFMTLLTLDDGVIDVPREQLAVF